MSAPKREPIGLDELISALRDVGLLMTVVGLVGLLLGVAPFVG